MTLPYKPPFILGHDLSGVVSKVGSSVRKFKVGDEVYARPKDHRIGTFAQLIAINENDVALKPKNLSMEEAASIPLVGLTAWQALIEKGKLKKGERVFIQAGSGGVGTFAVQLAKHVGATVATTTSAANIDLVKSLGADVVIDYRKDDFENELHGYDMVLNSQDRKTLGKSLQVLKPGGKLISISGPPDVELHASLKIHLAKEVVGSGLNTFSIDNWEGKKTDDRIVFEMRPVSYDMIETLGIQMVAGRIYSRNFGAEDSKIIFNQAAIEAMGLEDPIGKMITIQGSNLEIIGVTKDFHFASLHEEVNPLFFVLRPSWTRKIMVRIEAGGEREIIANLQKFYQAYNPGFPFAYQFLDQAYQAQYVAEQRVSILSRYFAGFAILISCLGLFGLVAFTTERRLKEIGIRKILGASEFGIVRLLSGDFTKLVTVAILVALPAGYYITKNWLDNFAYRIDLQWWFFIGPGLLALLIAWVTVALQTSKAARISPTQSLKNE